MINTTEPSLWRLRLLIVTGRSELDSFLTTLAREATPKGKDLTFYCREGIKLLGEREKLLTKKKRNIMAQMRKMKETLTVVMDEILEKEQKISKNEQKISKAQK